MATYKTCNFLLFSFCYCWEILKTNKILWKSKICSSQLLSNTFSSGGSFGSSCMQSFRLEPVKFASTDIFSEHLSRISGTISSSTHFPNINLCHLGTRSETWLRTMSVGDVWAREERSIIVKIVLFCCRRGLLALVPLIILYLCLRSGWWVVDDIRRAFKSLSSSTTSSICCFFPEQLCTAAGSLRKTSTICNNCPNIDILSIVIGKICARGVRCIWTFYSPHPHLPRTWRTLQSTSHLPKPPTEANIEWTPREILILCGIFHSKFWV